MPCYCSTVHDAIIQSMHQKYQKQIDAILKRLDAGRPSDAMLQRIQQHVNKLSETYEYDESLGSERFKLYVAQAVIDYYQGNEQRAKALMEEAIRVRGHSFGFADEFLSRISTRATAITTPRPRRSGTFAVTTGLVVAGILMLAVALSIVIMAKHPGPANSIAQYKASSIRISVINPATVSVGFRVTNIGKVSGTPSCTIDVQDPSYTYHGVDVVTLKDPLSPGQTINSADPSITITKQGAAYVTTPDVKCS